jgi:ferredoxin
MGVPIYTSHTVLSANGTDSVESVTIAAIDKNWKPIPGTEQTFACDTLLVAVGLDPVDEFYKKAVEFGLSAFAAGDADEVAEASAAMFSGKIRGLEIARALGCDVPEIPQDWFRTSDILKSRPGEITHETIPDDNEAVYPVLHCSQEIPCNPCTSVCSQGAIVIDDTDIRKVPDYIAKQIGKECIACEKCVTICPGLAITLIDIRKEEPETALVTIPYEFEKGSIRVGDHVTVLNTIGTALGSVEVVRTRIAKTTDRTVLVKVRAPREIANQIAGIEIQAKEVSASLDQYVERLTDDLIVCRCERVSLAEIKSIIQSGVTDMNEIKAITRAGMGACGGKTCSSLIKRAFRELGVPMTEITENVARPVFVEVPFGVLAGVEK